MTQTQYPFLDFYRVGIRTAGDMVRSSLAVAAQLHNHQLAVIKDALDSYAQVAALVDDANGPNEFITLPANLASMQSHTMMGYWSNFFQLAAEHQIESAGRCRAQAEQNRENFHKVLAAGSDGHASMVAALQPFINAASSACDLGRRASEEATRPVAAPFVPANTASERPEIRARKSA